MLDVFEGSVEVALEERVEFGLLVEVLGHEVGVLVKEYKVLKILKEGDGCKCYYADEGNINQEIYVLFNN